jgi:hypothetical protein
MMRDWLRRIAQVVLLAVSGGAIVTCGAYGMPIPHDPTVVLQDFSYTPASPIRVGDTLRLTATLNHTTYAGWLEAVFKHHKLAAVQLRDDGTAPDEVDGDGVYTGELTWSAELGDGKDLPVWVELNWDDGFAGQRQEAAPLTILPTEETQ